MNEIKRAALVAIDECEQLFTDVSDKIWEYAELSLMEHKSAALYVQVLMQNGFDVRESLSGMSTAFSGYYGSGRPVIGILAEYDALSGLSQQGCVAHREERVSGGSGHGCGHNLLGAGSLTAAFAVKRYLKTSGKPGTVVFYGCPGEKGGAGKAFMARERVWENLDAALTWHPGDTNEVTTGTCISCI